MHKIQLSDPVLTLDKIWPCLWHFGNQVRVNKDVVEVNISIHTCKIEAMIGLVVKKNKLCLVWMGPNVVHSAPPEPVNNMFWLWNEIRLFWENITATSTGVLKHWSLLSIMSTKTIDTQAIRVLFLFVVLCDSRITTFKSLKHLMCCTQSLIDWNMLKVV